MELVDVTTITEIKPGDTLIITGDTLINQLITVKKVKVSNNDGTEIIFNLKKNKYFNKKFILKFFKLFFC